MNLHFSLCSERIKQISKIFLIFTYLLDSRLRSQKSNIDQCDQMSRCCMTVGIIGLETPPPTTLMWSLDKFWWNTEITCLRRDARPRPARPRCRKRNKFVWNDRKWLGCRHVKHVWNLKCNIFMRHLLADSFFCTKCLLAPSHFDSLSRQDYFHLKLVCNDLHWRMFAFVCQPNCVLLKVL